MTEFAKSGGGFMSTAGSTNFAAPVQGARVLLDFNGATPSTQTFPASVAAALATTGRTFSSIFTFDQASGSPTTVGPVTLTASGTQRFRRTMPTWTGSSMLATRGVEFPGTGTTNYFTTSVGATWDLSTSLTFVMCCRVLRIAVDRSVLGKQASSTGIGYRVKITTAAGGPFIATVYNGAAAGAQATCPTAAANEVDAGFNGSLQWWAFKFDVTAQTIRILGQRATGSAVAMPAGPWGNATPWQLGSLPFYFDPETLQIAWLGVLTGAEAEAFDLTALNTLDTHARTPSIFAAYSRASCVSPDVGTEAGFGLRVGTYQGSSVVTSLVQFPHGYHVGATASAQKLGAWFGRGNSVSGGNKRNQYTRSDDLSHADWIKSSITATANAAEDPQGFHAAAQLTATAGNATIGQTKTVTANKAQVHSFYVRRAGGSDVSLVLRAVDTAGPTTIAQSAVTATSEWTRVSMLSQSATATSVRYELEIVTNGASIYATYGQQEYGWLTPYQVQRATLIDRADSSHYVDNAGNRYYDPAGGRVEVRGCQYHDNAIEDAYVFSTWISDGVTLNKDRLLIQVSDASGSTGTESEAFDLDVQHHDTSTAMWAQINAPNIDRNASRLYQYDWDARRRLTTAAGFAAIRQDVGVWDLVGATVPTAPMSYAATMPRIYPGARYTGDAGYEGIIESLAIYGAPP